VWNADASGSDESQLNLIVDAPNPSLRDRMQAAALRVGIRLARALGAAAASNLGGHGPIPAAARIRRR